MATIIPTLRGKLTLDTTSDTTKITSIVNYLKAEPDVNVVNGLGFGALSNRITAVKSALRNPAQYVTDMETTLGTAKNDAISNYKAALATLLDLGVAPKEAKMAAMQKAQANAVYDLKVLEMKFPSDVLESSLEQSGLETKAGTNAKRVGMLGAPKLKLIGQP